QKMLNVVGKLAVLVDSSKVGERAGMLFSRADEIDLLITGKQADPEILKKLEDQGVQVIRV
ncbi:MAG: HTH-type transcriptional regulator UlaR, partial [Kluyvera sp.]